MATGNKKDQDSPTLVAEFMEKAKARMKELEPAVREHQELTEFLNARQPNGNSSSTRTTRRRGGRRKGGGKRAEEFMNIVRENPGITVSEVARKMGIQPNYLYRINSDLKKDGKITDEGRGVKVVAESTSS